MPVIVICIRTCTNILVMVTNLKINSIKARRKKVKYLAAGPGWEFQMF